jgi:hypothetical protein
MTLKIAFDIGGVLSKYPQQFRILLDKLQAPGRTGLETSVEVYIISDMHDVDKMHQMLTNNGIRVDKSRVYSADYKEYGEFCKTHLCKQLGIDMLIDDFIGYVAEGDFIRMLVMPDAKQPYYHDDWQTDGSEGDFGRRRKKIQ